MEKTPMASFQIGITPSKRAAARFVGAVRRGLQMVLAEEEISQSDLARELGVHRSVISREIRGDKDITLGRIGELAFLLGRRAQITFPKREYHEGANNLPVKQTVPSEAIPASGTMYAKTAAPNGLKKYAATTDA